MQATAAAAIQLACPASVSARDVPTEVPLRYSELPPVGMVHTWPTRLKVLSIKQSQSNKQVKRLMASVKLNIICMQEHFHLSFFCWETLMLKFSRIQYAQIYSVFGLLATV